MTDVTETPAETLEKATRQDALPMDRLVLIGTFIKPDSATALLRTASGKIRAVSKGDRIGGAQVAGIEEGRVAIARDQRTIMLKLRPEMKRT